MSLIVGVITALVLIGAFLFVQNARAKPAEPDRPVAPLALASWPADQAAQEVEFWKVIEATSPANRGDEAQLDELRSQLSGLPTEDLEKFIQVNDRLMARTYNWDLWGAAYVIRAGASDDSFEDFRKWLISKGRVVFEAAVADPDNLAVIIPEGYTGGVTFEEFSYLFADIWSERTGKPITDLPKEKDSLYPSEPSGDPFEEETEDLAARYPKLSLRFREEPLDW